MWRANYERHLFFSGLLSGNEQKAIWIHNIYKTTLKNGRRKDIKIPLGDSKKNGMAILIFDFLSSSHLANFIAGRCEKRDKRNTNFSAMSIYYDWVKQRETISLSLPSADAKNRRENEVLFYHFIFFFFFYISFLSHDSRISRHDIFSPLFFSGIASFRELTAARKII